MSRWTTPCACAYASASRHVAQDAHRVGERHGTPRHARPERLAVARTASCSTAARPPSSPARQQRDDVRLLQRRREPDLAREPLGAQSLGQLRRQHLDDHVAPERVSSRDEHARHAAAAELALERVGRAERRLKALPGEVRHLATCRGSGAGYHSSEDTAKWSRRQPKRPMCSLGPGSEPRIPRGQHSRRGFHAEARRCAEARRSADPSTRCARSG